jgi:hypothetical protein
MKKRSPPHILADEHFEEACNPPAADYQTLDGVLKPPLGCIVSLGISEYFIYIPLRGMCQGSFMGISGFSRKDGDRAAVFNLG